MMSDLSVLLGDDPVTQVSFVQGGVNPKVFSTGTYGMPLTGTWQTYTMARDLAGMMWLCIASGSPGKWMPFSSTANPMPLGARVIGLGDSNTAGLTNTGVSAGPTTDSRPNLNSWFERLCAANPHRFYRLRNAGIGGDTVGGSGVLAAQANPGDMTVRVRLQYGHLPGTGNFMTLGTYGGTSEAVTYSSKTALDVNRESVITLSSPVVGTWAAGVAWGTGMIGRLFYDVIKWAPEVVLIMAGTNDLNMATGLEIAQSLVDLCTLLRMYGIEPILLEITPRSTFSDKVAGVNHELRHLCATNPSGRIHLVPTYQPFASVSGGFANGADTADGLHFTPQGYTKLANIVADYTSGLPWRQQRVPLADYNDDPSNRIVNNQCFSASGGGVPTSWTSSSFFGVNITPSVVAPAPGDGIVGNWFRFTAVAGTGNWSMSQAASPAPAIGDLLLVSCRMRTWAMSGGCTAGVSFQTGSFPIDPAFQVAESGRDDVMMCTLSRVTATSANALSMRIDPNGGSGVIDFAQPKVLNLTTLGWAA